MLVLKPHSLIWRLSHRIPPVVQSKPIFDKTHGTELHQVPIEGEEEDEDDVHVVSRSIEVIMEKKLPLSPSRLSKAILLEGLKRNF